jgi:hypothetical protein
MLPKDLLNCREQLAEELGINPKFDTSGSVMVVTGSNATGKSLVRRVICGNLKRLGIEAIHLSQQGRAQGGIARCFIYGSEDDESTGFISAKTFQGAFRTMRGREQAHVVIWDEPEIGMGEELQLGTADWLYNELARDWPKHLCGVVVLTHSRIFASKVMGFPDSKWLNMNGYGTLEEWLSRKIVPVGPEELIELGLKKWGRISKILQK